jgi:1-acyl-sn-glycerol-3-phosphate acyltransferase
MAGGTRRRKPARKRAVSGRSRAARPALGNDPFTRGAARRPEPPLAVAPERSREPPSPHPVTSPAEAQERVASVERRVEAALDGLDARLVDLAGRAGLRSAVGELREALGRLLPQLRAGLAAAVDLARLFEPAERLDRHGMDPRLVERFAPVLELLYASWWRTVVRDADRVPSQGGAVVVANHAGLVPWDAFVLRHALRRDHPAHRELRPLLDDRECALPLVGAAAVRLGAVRASPEAAEELLRDGVLVGVFPEGSAGARKPWRDRYRLLRFGRGGFVKLALRARVPIVPCAIVGSEEASAGISRTGWLAERLGMPFLSSGTALRFGPAALLPLPSRWSLRFGDPVPTEDLSPAAADDPDTVNALTERVRGTLQSMLDEDLAARSAVFL